MPKAMGEILLRWYARHARALPWRGSDDPYTVWVSEVMLQQTRVETVIPYFERWMARFPTLAALAQADRDEVLSHWEGLGYYQRAHNLHQAARLLVTGEAIPDDPAALERLPGVGTYTAAAIAALAFNLDMIALDGNLRRVIARLLDLELDPKTPAGERALRAWAEDALPRGKAAVFNQALMDLGALVCTPRSPRCDTCPLETSCLAAQRGTQTLRPVRKPRRARPHHIVAAGVVEREGKVLICRRPRGELLGGLWEFPGGKQEDGETLQECLRRELTEELGVVVQAGPQLGTFKHAYTHFSITVHAFICQLEQGEPGAREHDEILWIEPASLATYPMGKVDRAIANRLIGSDGRA